MTKEGNTPTESPDKEELLIRNSNKGKEPDNDEVVLTVLNEEQNNENMSFNSKPENNNRISLNILNKGKSQQKLYSEPSSSEVSEMGGDPDGLSINTSIITDTTDTNNQNNQHRSHSLSLRNKRFSYNTPAASSSHQWNTTGSGTLTNVLNASRHSSITSLNNNNNNNSNNNNNNNNNNSRPSLGSYPLTGSFVELLNFTNNLALGVNSNSSTNNNDNNGVSPSSRHNSFSSNLQQNFYRLGLSDNINIETVDPTPENQENNERPSQVGPGENAWLLFRVYAIFKFIWSFVFSILYIVHFIKKSKSCDTKIFKFSIVFAINFVIQAISSLLLIIYLPTSITRYTNVIRRKVVISSRAWKVSAYSFIVEVVLIIVGIILLFGKDPSCSISKDVAYVNIIKVIALIVVCFFTFICFPIFIIPCACTFKLLPKYRGISNKVLKKFNSFLYNPPEEVDEENAPSCSICMENYEPGTRIKRLPCNHEFHPDCIIPWLETNNSCPICRQTFN